MKTVQKSIYTNFGLRGVDRFQVEEKGLFRTEVGLSDSGDRVMKKLYGEITL